MIFAELLLKLVMKTAKFDMLSAVANIVIN